MSQTACYPTLASTLPTGGAAQYQDDSIDFEKSAPDPSFVGQLESALMQATRTGESVAVFALRLEPSANSCKPIEVFLLEASRRIDQSLRLCDTAFYSGGGCFRLMQRALSGRSGAILRARTLLAQLAEPFKVNGDRFHLTVKIGLSVDSPGIGSEMLLLNAEDALRRALYTDDDLLVAAAPARSSEHPDRI